MKAYEKMAYEKIFFSHLSEVVSTINFEQKLESIQSTTERHLNLTPEHITELQTTNDVQRNHNKEELTTRNSQGTHNKEEQRNNKEEQQNKTRQQKLLLLLLLLLQAKNTYTKNTLTQQPFLPTAVS